MPPHVNLITVTSDSAPLLDVISSVDLEKGQDPRPFYGPKCSLPSRALVITPSRSPCVTRHSTAPLKKCKRLQSSNLCPRTR